MSFKRHMPSINALVTFEAAMRLKSFTAAARELNVTQAAVSRQIRLLEDDFGLPLFQRGHRRVQPTTSGDLLGTTMREALEMVKETVETLRGSQDTQTLTVGATLAFSYFWLLPKLSAFREECPELKIRLVTQDEPFDLNAGELDVVIRFGKPPFDDGLVVVAANDRVFPVCSPSFADRLPTPFTPTSLKTLPLIGSDGADTSWMFWSDWFQHVGQSRRAPRPALQFNHYTDGIAAALAGQGIALGWEMIVEDMISRGQLMCLGEKLKIEATYNAVLPLKRPTTPAAHSFVQWIGRMFGQSRHEATADSSSQSHELQEACEQHSDVMGMSGERIQEVSR